ncbi:hypothetical protein [Prescottella equi]|nr:hypothetical protein [Prescottella equi]MDP8017136.1 hypothetical protein [Prescottella equi]
MSATLAPRSTALQITDCLASEVDGQRSWLILPVRANVATGVGMALTRQ